jgi:tetratricopeptide (TPR) repeat protein
MKRNRLTGLALSCLALLAPTPGLAAEWRRAETPRFIVYSDGNERSLRDSALQLELYENALRNIHGLDPNGASPQRIAIYLVQGFRDLKAVEPGLRDEVAGFYQATNDEIFALAIRERRDMQTLLHEYAHHFMMDSFLTGAAGFPAWFIEGYAEYFSNAELQPTRMVVGDVNRGRADWLNYNAWLPLNLILTRRPFEFQDPKAVSMYYAQSWLLAHWFVSSPQRMPMLYAYIDNLQRGMEVVPAMEAATGMTLAQLERQQQAYIRQRLAIKIITSEQFRHPEIKITTLSPAEGDLLLLGLRLSSTVGEDAALLAEIQRRTAPYAGESAADLLLARAELRLGDKARAVAILERVLAAAPDDVDALRLLGDTLFEQARDQGGDRDLLRQARVHLAQAYRLNPDDYRVLTLLAETRQGSPDFPSDNDVETLLAAIELAPQVASLRVFTAQVRAHREEYPQAIALLQPLAASPHPDGATALSRALIERYREAMTPSDDATSVEASAPEDAEASVASDATE